MAKSCVGIIVYLLLSYNNNPPSDARNLMGNGQKIKIKVILILLPRLICGKVIWPVALQQPDSLQ